MQRNTPQLSWRRWLRLNRLIPSITILGAGLINVLSLLGFLKLTTPEAVIIALLALLAIDSLVERIGILERLEHKLNTLTSVQSLSKRATMPRPADQAMYASEICILAVSAHFVIPQYVSFYENKLKSGCVMRLIILNPESPALETWKSLSQSTITKSHIEGTLAVLQRVVGNDGRKLKCEVRLSDIVYPFSIFGVDMDKGSGTMVVEYYTYKVHIDERPHIQLSASGNPDWFYFYRQQFEAAWEDARVWDFQSNPH